MKTFFLLLFFALFSFSAQARENLLVLGDSISAAYGIEIEQGWVSLLQQRLQQQGYNYQLINASISGETSAGGLTRLPALLQRFEPDLVVIELGANDGLRGLSLQQLKANLQQMVILSRAQGARVLLLGMYLPPNYGEAYNQAFHQVYTQLAQEQQIMLVPFLMDKVGGVDQLMQADGLHPTAEAQPIMLENVWPRLEPMLAAGKSGPVNTLFNATVETGFSANHR